MNLTEKDLTIINRALRNELIGKSHTYRSEVLGVITKTNPNPYIVEVMETITKIDKLFHELQKDINEIKAVTK